MKTAPPVSRGSPGVGYRYFFAGAGAGAGVVVDEAGAEPVVVTGVAWSTVAVDLVPLSLFQ
jgi:kynureninase